ncbi:hypothetical protein ElyMa_004757700 [Elysia marginata]|uniref:Uncharacterized protein n=1 Tax=Elysia marginata TaxID=1093978 RepID=A0AAV4IIJ1_9GAST|nr:hypothetical protein ElyMa_004757700 [Elysia marginata]
MEGEGIFETGDRENTGQGVYVRKEQRQATEKILGKACMLENQRQVTEKILGRACMLEESRDSCHACYSHGSKPKPTCSSNKQVVDYHQAIYISSQVLWGCIFQVGVLHGTA